LPEDVGKGDGRWLGRDVYLAANSFFQITSDLLPAEPHLSSSAEGDLVAEFASSVGRMTLIVTRDSAFAFAVVGGKPLQSVLGLTPIEPAKLRAELGRVTDALRAASHGALEPGR
jgi:hypothetical protein